MGTARRISASRSRGECRRVGSCERTTPTLFPFAFLVPFVYLFCAIDAYRAAEELNARALGAASCGAEIAESPWWGASLMLLGLVLLLHNLGWIDVAALRRYWPVALIVAGGVSLGSSLVRRRARVGEA